MIAFLLSPLYFQLDSPLYLPLYLRWFLLIFDELLIFQFILDQIRLHLLHFIWLLKLQHLAGLMKPKRLPIFITILLAPGLIKPTLHQIIFLYFVIFLNLVLVWLHSMFVGGWIPQTPLLQVSPQLCFRQANRCPLFKWINKSKIKYNFINLRGMDHREDIKMNAHD